jgi:hypothetical protein
LFFIYRLLHRFHQQIKTLGWIIFSDTNINQHDLETKLIKQKIPLKSVKILPFPLVPLLLPLFWSIGRFDIFELARILQINRITKNTSLFWRTIRKMQFLGNQRLQFANVKSKSTSIRAQRKGKKNQTFKNNTKYFGRQDNETKNKVESFQSVTTCCWSLEGLAGKFWRPGTLQIWWSSCLCCWGCYEKAAGFYSCAILDGLFSFATWVCSLLIYKILISEVRRLRFASV